MDIIYTLIRCKRKTVSIRIGDGGEIIVRAPKKIKKAELDRIVAQNSVWIEKHSEICAVRERAYSKIDGSDEKLFREAARIYLGALTDKTAELTGLRPSSVRIGSAKKRFGSCSSKGSLNFSFYLMLYPPAAAEYVVLHELCHLVHMNHSPAFYALIERYMPDWRERRAHLSASNLMSTEEAAERCRRICECAGYKI